MPDDAPIGRRLQVRELPSDGLAPTAKRPRERQPNDGVDRTRAGRAFAVFLKIACWTNLAIVAGVWLLVRFLGESWYLTTALLYLPRWPWLLPSIPLTLAAAWVWRRGLWLTLPAIALVAGPLCGLRLGWAGWTASALPQLSLVTVNIQNGQPNLRATLGEIERRGIELICCQEVDSEQLELIETAAAMGLADQHYDSYFWTASSRPLTKIDVLESQASFRDIAAVYRIDDAEVGGRPVHLVNVHLSTARFGLKNLRPRTPLTGIGLDELAAAQSIRMTEIAELAALLARLAEEGEVVACGDFNMPTDSTAFAPLLEQYRSAFDTAGLGYGYTVPNDAGHGWPRGFCWLRVDHVLITDGLTPLSADEGDAAGSDHRAMFATIGWD